MFVVVFHADPVLACSITDTSYIGLYIVDGRYRLQAAIEQQQPYLSKFAPSVRRCDDSLSSPLCINRIL